AAEMPPCHSQGLAVSVLDNALVSTCMGNAATPAGHAAHLVVHALVTAHPDQPRPARAHLSVVLTARDRGGARSEHGGPLPAQALAAPGPFLSHPSATQIVEGVFPVAFTVRRAHHGPAAVRFYALSATGGLAPAPQWPAFVVPDHLGALGWGQVAGGTYLVGCTWNCDQLWLWRAGAAGAGSHGTTQRFQALIGADGVDQVHRNYNALFITHTCTEGTPLLFATAEHWVDLWELVDLASPPHLRLRKRVSVAVAGPPGNLLHEGVSVVRVAGRLTLL